MSQQPDQITDPEVPTEAPGPDGDLAAPADTDPSTDAAGVSEPDDHTELAEVDEDPRTREELLTATHEAERQRDEYLDDLRRARAEFENFRRRTARESASARDVGRGDVAAALLEVLDDVDRTLEAAEASSDEGLAKGVVLVAEKLVGTLQQLGLVRVEPTGEVFDPSLHEAVQQVASDEPVDDPVVEQTLRVGYRFGDRVLRPAMVVVRG